MTRKHFAKIHHYLLMVFMLASALVCAFFIPRVKVNSDMTLYLPAESQLRQGLSVLQQEFPVDKLTLPAIKVLFGPQRADERQRVRAELQALPEVSSVMVRLSPDSAHTLYELQVPGSVNQKALGADISERYGEQVVVETGQDGATPPFSVIVLAVILVVVVLLLTAQSWLDPVLFLFCAGVAVVLNIGTNALLPSVSITTNYIGSILQLVLSLDFSIVLLNRYRQELRDDRTLVESVNAAIRRAVPPVMSSALTTILGLLVLVFMRLRIGMDMGVVLAKGVLFSLICTFTVLPALLLMCHGAIQKTAKPTFVLPTDRLSRLITHHKTPLAILAIVLFGLSFWYSRKTPIYFCTKGESRIEQVFPQANPFVLIYDAADADSVIALADALHALPESESVLSYPSLLQRSFAANEFGTFLLSLQQELGDMVPADAFEGLSPEMIEPDMLRMLYCMQAHTADSLRLTMAELMQFVLDSCATNPLFASSFTPEIQEQMEVLPIMLEEARRPAPKAPKRTKHKAVAHTTFVPDSTSLEGLDTLAILAEIKDEEVEMQEVNHFSDTVMLRRPMTIDEMSDYMGSTLAQTKLVYVLAHADLMTPWDYTVYLTDDLFRRRLYRKFVSDEQQAMLWAVREEMERAFAAQPIEVTSVVADTLLTDSLASGHTVSMPVAAASHPHPVAKPAPQEDPFVKMLRSKKTYAAPEMASRFASLGFPLDTATVSLLYTYYCSTTAYPDSLTMTPEHLLNYLADTLLQMPAVASYLPESTREMICSSRDQLAEAGAMLSNSQHGVLLVLTDLLPESDATYAFVDTLTLTAARFLPSPHYMMGESVMFSEMRQGFSREMTLLTLLTILVIFIVVAITFRSVVVPTILVMTVMTAVFVNVVFSGLISGKMLYLAYLIVQSILMGATIDYGILFTSYYQQFRRTEERYEACRLAYRGSIRTIMTSGLIMIGAPGLMALFVEDVAISSIVGCIAIGAFCAVSLILTSLPAILVALDRFTSRK